MLQIDGSYGEGGGQLLRTAAALAAITGRAFHLVNVRAKRDKPGLAPQHLAALRAAATLCDARCEGLELRSQDFSFAPGDLRGGEFRIDVGTAGSLTLVLQALLPAMLCAPAPSRVIVTGGTDVRAAPPLDYFRHVILGLLRIMGARIECRVMRRGYYPRGGGEVEVAVQPCRLRALELGMPGALRSLEGLAHVANLPLSIAGRMRKSALAALGRTSEPDEIETAALGRDAAFGSGGAIVCWARLQHTVLGAGRVAERGLRAEALGDVVGAELRADLAAGVSLDQHAADQMLVYLGLAGGSFSVRVLSNHARTGMWLIEQFMPVRFDVATGDRLVRVRARRP